MTSTDPNPKININSKQEKEALEKLTKQIAKGGGISFLGQVFSRGVTFVLQILLTRILGAARYGLYALGINVFGINQTFANMGLYEGVVRFGSMFRGERDEENLKGTLLYALFISTAISILITVIIIFFADLISVKIFNKPDFARVLKYFAIALPFYTLMCMAAHSARAFRRMDYYTGILYLFNPVVNLIIVIIVFSIGGRLYGAIFGFIFSAVVSAFLGIYLLWRIFPKLISDLQPKCQLKKMFFYSSIIFLIGISNILFMKTDRIMLGIFGSARDIGIYNAAAGMAAQAGLFLLSFSSIFSPVVVDLYNRKRIIQLKNLFKTTTKWIFSTTLLIFLIFIVYSREILSIYGSEFEIGFSVLIVLGTMYLLMSALGPCSLILIMTNREKLELINNFSLGALNILLAYLLIPKYGILGAAIATGLSVTFANFLKLIEVYFIYKMHPYKLTFWKPILAGIITIGFNKALKIFFDFREWWWILGVVLLIVIYIIMIKSFGLDQEDKLIIKALGKRIQNLKKNEL